MRPREHSSVDEWNIEMVNFWDGLVDTANVLFERGKLGWKMKTNEKRNEKDRKLFSFLKKYVEKVHLEQLNPPTRKFERIYL